MRSRKTLPTHHFTLGFVFSYASHCVISLVIQKRLNTRQGFSFTYHFLIKDRMFPPIIPKAKKQQCCAWYMHLSRLVVAMSRLPITGTGCFTQPTYQARRKQKHSQAEVFILPKKTEMLPVGDKGQRKISNWPDNFQFNRAMTSGVSVSTTLKGQTTRL